jgi:tol-pal system protein YbgF
MSGTSRTALLLILLAVAAQAPAASKSELEARIVQLERKLDSRSLVDMLNQVTELQRQMQQLRGDIEVQNHTLENLQKRQRDLYLDIDRRLHRLEAGGVAEAPSPGMSGSAPAAGVAAAGAAAGAPATPAVAPATGAPAVAAATPALNPAEERKAYDQALELLKEGRYNDAAGAFQGFLKQYPGSSYADNAQYWLGEVYYVTRQFPAALAEFDKVLKNHPGSPKAADAKLKQGYIQYELKDWGKSRTLLGEVVSGYPGTTSARLAQERLDRLKQEGH